MKFMKVTDLKLSRKISLEEWGAQLESTGFQATELARAVDLLNRMYADKECTRFLAFTSNLMASGLRGLLMDLVEEKKVDAVITAGGALDHDLLRSYREYGVGSFQEDDAKLHKKGVNRLGNILVDNAHYVFLEKWVQPLLKKMHAENRVVSPREVASALGEKLARDKKRSFLAACYKNNIPVFCPGIVDSALGLQMHFFKQDHPGFAVDATGDMKELATLVLSAKRTGALVLGGGISKHYTIASNLLRGGLDYAVYVTTSGEYDGSLSGAPAKEAKSWGKIREKAQTAVVHGEATLVFPLLHALTTQA